MFLEAVLTRADVQGVLAQVLPATIDLGEGRSLRVEKAELVELVPDAGVRVQCAATIVWSFAGMKAPIEARELTLLLLPSIGKRTSEDGVEGDVLELRAKIEDADIAKLPSILEPAAIGGINAALASKPFTWDFTRTLSHTFLTPSALREIAALRIRVAWGKTKVTSDALGLAVSLELAVDRR